MANRSQQSAEPSLTALLGGIMNNARDLLRQELTLAKLEGQDELRQIKTAALYLGIGIGVVTVSGMLLSVMLVHVLAAYTDMPLWGCYGIVGSVLAVFGGVFQDEMVSLRIIAVRAVMSTLCEMFKQAIPPLAPHIESAMTKRGGQPIDSPEQHLAFMSRAAANGVPS